MGLLLGGKTLVGLDIGSTMVKAIEITRKGKKYQITGFGMAIVKKSISDAIIEAFTNGNIDTRKVATAVSGRSETVVKYISLPKVPDEDIKGIMEGELDKYIPWDIDDCIFDCQKMPSTEADSSSGKMKVLMVATKKKLIKSHHQLLNDAGLKSKIIDVEAFALGNAYELGFSQNETLAEDVTAIIDVGATKTNINIMSGTSSYFTREIFSGGNDLTQTIAKRFGESKEDIEKMKLDPGEAKEPMLEIMTSSLEEICNEIKLSFDYFENQFDQQVRQILLCGGVIRFPGLPDIFSQMLNTPCSIWDPTQDIDMDASQVNVKNLKDNAMILGISLGLAARA